jgi:hypothetical protein
LVEPDGGVVGVSDGDVVEGGGGVDGVVLEGGVDGDVDGDADGARSPGRSPTRSLRSVQAAPSMVTRASTQNPPSSFFIAIPPVESTQHTEASDVPRSAVGGWCTLDDRAGNFTLGD